MIAFASDPEPTPKKRALERTPQPPQQLATQVIVKYRAYLDNMLEHAAQSYASALQDSEIFGNNDPNSASAVERYAGEQEAVDQLIRVLEGTSSPMMDMPENPQQVLQDGIQLLNRYKPMAKQFGCSEDEMNSLIADVTRIAGFSKAAGVGGNKPGGAALG